MCALLQKLKNGRSIADRMDALVEALNRGSSWKEGKGAEETNEVLIEKEKWDWEAQLFFPPFQEKNKIRLEQEFKIVESVELTR